MAKEQMAQFFYLAQLQACKGKCQCNVCQLIRKAVDEMTEEALTGNPSPVAAAMKAMSATGGGGAVEPGATEIVEVG